MSAGLLGMKVMESSAVPADMVLMVSNGEMLHRFVWTANALAEQEREIEALRAEVKRLRSRPCCLSVYRACGRHTDGGDCPVHGEGTT